jgi:hypothetical protein
MTKKVKIQGQEVQDITWLVSQAKEKGDSYIREALPELANQHIDLHNERVEAVADENASKPLIMAVMDMMGLDEYVPADTGKRIQVITPTKKSERVVSVPVLRGVIENLKIAQGTKDFILQELIAVSEPKAPHLKVSDYTPKK